MNAYIPQYRLTLTAGEHSARHIRHIVRSLLDEWEMQELSDAVELGITEVIANVVRHVPDRRCQLLLLRQGAAGVRVEVADGSPQLPVVPTELSWESEGGRGLVLLDAMAAKWGVWPEAGGGKTVWFECRGDDSG
ncbi:ATP-binding protein [Streptomyces sp. A30]|uniref:ATP-binding protein n=1 Tax=Streptomyces sp. A30 TaxID=2789273 RepID=UPI003980B31A